MYTPEAIERRKRFLDRIWKRIYRDPVTCPCPICKQVDAEWLIVEDKIHAVHLRDVESDYAAEWVILNYRDEK